MNIVLFEWLSYFKIIDIIILIRSNIDFTLPFIIVYVLPDAIWLYSGTYLMLMIWKKINIYSFLFIFSFVFLGLLIELFQKINFINGRFCIYDCIFSIISFIISILFFYNKECFQCVKKLFLVVLDF